MTILIIGGTGKTGRPLTAFLREHDVRIACRNPGPDGTYFDWADTSTYRPALDGVDRVFMVPPLATTDPMPMAGPFLEAARSAGVRRVVLLGALAVLHDSSGMDALYAAVRAMPQGTVLRPSGFMQNFTGDHPLAVNLRERGELHTATGQGRLGWIDTADIAAVAAAALLDPVAPASEYILTGPESLNYAEAATVLTEITGRRIRQVDITVEAAARRHMAAGLPEKYAWQLATMDADISEGSEDRTTSTVYDLTGRQPRSFRDFVRAHSEWAHSVGSASTE